MFNPLLFYFTSAALLQQLVTFCAPVTGMGTCVILRAEISLNFQRNIPTVVFQISQILLTNYFLLQIQRLLVLFYDTI